MMILDNEVLMPRDILAEPVQIEAVMHVEWKTVAMCSGASHRSNCAVIWKSSVENLITSEVELTKVR